LFKELELEEVEDEELEELDEDDIVLKKRVEKR